MRILKFTAEQIAGTTVFRAVCILSDGRTATALFAETPDLPRLQEMLDTVPEYFEFYGPD